MSDTPTTADLLLAFRQAKRACGTERMAVGLHEFAKFELDLHHRIGKLRGRLGRRHWFSDIPLGRVVVVPKGVKRSATKPDIVRVGLEREPPSALTVRLQLAPTPEFTTTEVLYLWRFAPALEALLSPSCVGYRHRGIQRDGAMSRDVVDIYEHWQSAFGRYRDEPIQAAHSILERGGCAVVTSTDVATFFDSIDPAFLLDDRFVRRIASAAKKTSRHFDALDYRAATTTLLAAFDSFREQRQSLLPRGVDAPVGVPIGALTSRLIANVALAPLDAHIANAQGVVLYRRYVDDIVVVRSVEASERPPTRHEALAACFPNLIASEDSAVFEVPSTSGRFRLNADKTRVHELSGQAGVEFLKTVGQSFALVTSERRALLGDVDLLESEIEAIDLFDSDTGAADHIPRLRDADRFTLRRYIATAFIRALERYARLLDRAEASELVERRVERILSVLDAGEPFENLEFVFALLRVAVLLDHAELRERLEGWLRQAELIEATATEITWCGETLRLRRAIDGLARYLRERLDQTVASVLDYRSRGGQRVDSMALRLRHADLRHLDREDDVAMFGVVPELSRASLRALRAIDEGPLDAAVRGRLRKVRAFLGYATDPAWTGVDAVSLLLATRPPRFFDVARRVLASAATESQPSPGNEIAEIVDGLRGTRYVKRSLAVDFRQGAHGATLSIAHWQPRVLRVVVANLPVEGDDFDAAAKGTPRVTLGRLVALDEALREARRATQEAKRSGNPTLLVLPEISVPRRLERTLVRHAATEGISLIAGLEYRRSGAVVFNEAIGVFPQGFDKTFPVTWTKLHPASNERRLLGGHGVQLSAVGAPVDRLVVETSHGRIGVLICSEILEASALADLSGRIELLVVPAWNDDTGTFEHLTHAASSMLVHSFVAVANNAGASDSRIVAPVGQPRHLREWTRIIHRGHSRVVWGDLPTGLLRAVHDGKRDASEGGDMKSPSFRPLPPGWRQ